MDPLHKPRQTETPRAEERNLRCTAPTTACADYMFADPVVHRKSRGPAGIRRRLRRCDGTQLREQRGTQVLAARLEQAGRAPQRERQLDAVIRQTVTASRH